MIDLAQLKRLLAQVNMSHDAASLLPLARVIWIVATTEERECDARNAQIAIDEIDRLSKQVESLSAALKKIASCESKWPGDVVDIARVALATTILSPELE